MQLIPEISYENNLLGNPDYIEELIYGEQAEDFDDGRIYRSLDYEYFLNGGITSSALRSLTQNLDETVIDYAFRLQANQNRDLIQQEISEYSFFQKIIRLIKKGEAVWLGLMRLFPDLNEETDIDQLYDLYQEVIGHYFHNDYSSGKWGSYFSTGGELFSVLKATGVIEITSAVSPSYDNEYAFHCDGYDVTKMYAASNNLRYSQIGEYGYIRDIDSENLRIENADFGSIGCPDQAADVLCVIRPAIHHRQKNPLDPKLRIDLSFYLVDRLQKLLKALGRQVVGLNRDQCRIRSDERIHCQHPQTRHAVQQHVVVSALDRFKKLFQNPLPVHRIDQSHLQPCHCNVGWDQVYSFLLVKNAL